MKALTRFIFLMTLIFVPINTLAQFGLEGKKSVYLQLGASGGYSPNLSKPVLIPQLSLDATLGIFGIRAAGQFFKTSPEFDINAYLGPIKSVLTISNLQESNSNVLLGFTPYLNIGNKALSFQPGIGLKYLMQKGATATAVYNQIPATSILKFPNGDANRNLFVIEPNIRASFGKPNNLLRFFIEAGYSFPVGKNEISYSSRSLTGVVDPRGNVDVKALLDSKTILSTEKSLPAFASVGAGIEIKLFSRNEQDKPLDQQLGNMPIKPKKPKEPLNEPDSYEIHEIKPLMLIAKGAEKQPKKENVLEFKWLALNADDCGPLQYEFTIREINDEGSAGDKGDLFMFRLPEQYIYKKVLNENNLIVSGKNAFKHTILKNEMPELFEKGKQFNWQVKAMDATGNFPQCAWGGNNTIQGVYKGSGCGIKVLIDTILCSPTPPRPELASFEIKFRIKNNADPQYCTNTNAIFNGNQQYYPNSSNIKLTDLTGQPIAGMSYSPTNPLAGLTLPIGQTSNQYSVTITLPSGSGISGVRLHAWPTYITDPAYGAAYDDKNLPACGCNFCNGVSITISTPKKPPSQTLSQSGYDVFSFPVSITYSPWPVNRIVAEIVAFQHDVNTGACITCNTDNRMHGVFVGSAQNHIVGYPPSQWLNSGNASFYPAPQTFSREATWSTISQNGVMLNGQVMMLNIGVPVQNSLACCQDRIRWTIRYSFFSIDEQTRECRVCEITKSYCRDRTGNVYPRSLICRELPIPIPIEAFPIKLK